MKVFTPPGTIDPKRCRGRAHDWRSHQHVAELHNLPGERQDFCGQLALRCRKLAVGELTGFGRLGNDGQELPRVQAAQRLDQPGFVRGWTYRLPRPFDEV